MVYTKWVKELLGAEFETNVGWLGRILVRCCRKLGAHLHVLLLATMVPRVGSAEDARCASLVSRSPSNCSGKRPCVQAPAHTTNGATRPVEGAHPALVQWPCINPTLLWPIAAVPKTPLCSCSSSGMQYDRKAGCIGKLSGPALRAML